MTDLPPEMPPDIPVAPARRSLWDRVSIVWLVPLAALAVALAVGWQSLASRGPLIEIAFTDASGIAPRETQLRFRDVAVGVVESLRFSPDFDKVIVSVRLEPDVRDYVDADSSFWVVRPQVTAQGITGLETVLSGVYIKGQWDTEAGGFNRSFEGLAEAPLLSADEQGTMVVLRATNGGLGGNVPLLYKGIEVGRVGPATVTLDGSAVEAEAVVLEPWDALLTQTTRFYNVSGFSLSFGANGASINFDSAASLLVGGVSFDTWISGAPLAQEGQSFTVYADADSARASVFSPDAGEPLMLTAVFEGNVTGLAIGAAVEIDGLRIGEVTALTGIVDQATYGDGRVRLLTQLAIQPARLGIDAADGTERALAILSDQVTAGLRARLVTGSLLNGALKVQLTTVPGLEPGEIDMDAQPYPALPVAASEIADIQATAQGTLDRINNLPIEELLASAKNFLDSATTLVASEDTQAVPGDVRRIIAQIETLTSSEGVQALPARLDAAATDLQSTLAEAQSLLAGLNEGDGAARLLATVDSAQATLDQIRTAAEGVPDLVARIDAFVARADTLPLDQIATEAEALLADTRALIGSDGVQAVPAQVSDAIASLRAVIDEVQGSGVVGNVDSAVTELRGVIADVDSATADIPALVDDARAALDQIREATTDLPDLIANADAVAEALAGADLQGTVAGARDLIAGLSDFLSRPEVQGLPGTVSDTVAGIGAMVDDLTEAGAVDSLNAAIASVEDAAGQVAASTEGLPGLIDRANGVLGSADTALSGLSDLGQTMRDVRTALREISRAADAVASLATRLERSPNALIFGN